MELLLHGFDPGGSLAVGLGYESRRKSPTLEVVERLLHAADAELAVKPLVEFEYLEDPELGLLPGPNRLWQVPVLLCFSRVQVFPFRSYADGKEIWDLPDPEERIEYYELVLCRGLDDMLLQTVDAALLVEGWPRMNLPDAVREAWQPLINEARGGASRGDPLRDPGFDRNLRDHVYDLLEPDQPIERLLAEYADDPTCIFKG